MDEMDFFRSSAFRYDLQAFFFEAMLAGYAAEAPVEKTSFGRFPGSKMPPPYVKGPWELIDLYFVTATASRSGGMTIVWYDRIPVWMMSYFGEYTESALPCLKAALRKAYTEGRFFGGRGPSDFSHGDFSYYNTSTQGVLDHFVGEEWVDDLRGKEPLKVGWHVYHGGLLV